MGGEQEEISSTQMDLGLIVRRCGVEVSYHHVEILSLGLIDRGKRLNRDTLTLGYGITRSRERPRYTRQASNHAEILDGNVTINMGGAHPGAPSL